MAVNGCRGFRVYDCAGPPSEPRSSLQHNSQAAPPDALCSLRDLIAVLDSDNVPAYTAESIKSLYYSIRRQAKLPSLSDGDFDTLISFFGSLSIRSAGEVGGWTASSLFRLHRAASTKTLGTHWSFVLTLAYDKRECTHNVTIQDRFWLMYAALAKVMVLCRQQDAADHPNDFHRLLSYARREYHHIRDLTHASTVHVPWLTALLSFGTAPALNEALFNAARLIRRTPEIDASLQAVIWRLLSPGSAVASDKMRSEFCVALRRRLGVGPRRPQHETPSAALARQSAGVGKGYSSPCTDTFLDLDALHTCLTTAFFSDSHTDSVHFLRRWAVREVREVVSADTTTLWRRLSLFALAHNLSMGHADDTDLSAIDSIGELRTSSLTSTLLILQIIHQVATDAKSLPDGIHPILRSLWSAWLALGTPRRRKRTPIVVEQILWLAFIRIAGLFEDTGLLSQMCTIEPFKWRLVSVSSADEPFPPTFREAASIAIASAAAACGARTWDTILYYLEDAQIWQDELSLRKLVSDVVIREWAVPGRETAVAVKLYTEASPFELVSSEVIHTLAQACLRDNLIREAFACLADPALLGEPRADLVDTLIGRLRNYCIREMPVDMATTLGTSMCTVASSQAQLVHARSWEWAVSALARSECAPLAANVALALAEHHPRLCSRHWWTTFIHQLCRQRLFRIALRLVEGMPQSHYARRAMCLALVRRLGNASASRLAWRAWHLLPPGRLPAQVKLLEKVGFRGHAPTMHDSRTIVPFLFPSGQPRHAGSKAYALALRLLVRSKRGRAVKRLYEHIQSTDSDSALKTLASNIFLSASFHWSRRRNARQFRGLLHILNRLVTDDGFIPDRVTLNVLLKAALRWHVPMDAQKLRVLFDRLISSGYPASHLNSGPNSTGENAPGLPFGTPLARARQLPPLMRGLPPLDGPLSFGTDVRPLYKMFVKAFRSRGDWEAARIVVQILGVVRNMKRADSDDEGL